MLRITSGVFFVLVWLLPAKLSLGEFAYFSNAQGFKYKPQKRFEVKDTTILTGENRELSLTILEPIVSKYHGKFPVLVMINPFGFSSKHQSFVEGCGCSRSIFHAPEACDQY